MYNSIHIYREIERARNYLSVWSWPCGFPPGSPFPKTGVRSFDDSKPVLKCARAAFPYFPGISLQIHRNPDQDNERSSSLLKTPLHLINSSLYEGWRNTGSAYESVIRGCSHTCRGGLASARRPPPDRLTFLSHLYNGESRAVLKGFELATFSDKK